MPVQRLLQFSPNSTITTNYGSTRANIDSSVGSVDSKPDGSQAIFVDLADFDQEKIEQHINASSPIVFYVPDKEINTTELETFLLQADRKAPIYFAYNQPSIHGNFTHVRTSQSPSNGQNKKAKLQNIIGTINSSKTYERERVVVLTAPYDTFATVPAAKTGSNVNGIALAALLETMRLISKFPITNNWCFIFAVTDGHFCNFEGLEKFLTSLTSTHSSKIEFAASIEGIASKSLQGHFSMRLKRDSSFAKFMRGLKDALNQTGIQLEADLSEEKHGQTVFGSHLIKSISITGNGDELARITDTKPDINRANAIAWALSEALLRMMYDSSPSATMIEYTTVNASYWSRALSIPRMPTVRDRAFSDTIGQWMKSFGTVQYDDWSSNKCPAVYQATEATLILYHKTPFSTSLILFAAAIVYGIVVLVVIGRENLKKFFQ